MKGALGCSLRELPYNMGTRKFWECLDSPADSLGIVGLDQKNIVFRVSIALSLFYWCTADILMFELTTFGSLRIEGPNPK